MPIRTVFMGTPDFAVASLRALVDDPRVSVSLVLSQPDRPAGRGHRLTPPPVAAAAADLEIPLWQPASLRPDDAFERLRDEAPDLVVVAAYGQILRPRVLEIPPFGCVNVHASLLPRWRGAAPIHRAIEAGDDTTGVCIMRMEAGLDTGPVYACAETPIADTDTTGEVHDRLAELGATALVDALDRIVDPAFVPTPQPADGITYAAKLGPDDKRFRADLGARALARHINAMSPWPGVKARLGDDEIGLWRARPTATATDAPAGTLLGTTSSDAIAVAAADGLVVELLELQRPGRRRMSAADFHAGAGDLSGARLEAP